jgi:hypothetical protein
MELAGEEIDCCCELFDCGWTVLDVMKWHGFRVVGNAAAWAAYFDIDWRRGRTPAGHICPTAHGFPSVAESGRMAFMNFSSVYLRRRYLDMHIRPPLPPGTCPA